MRTHLHILVLSLLFVGGLHSQNNIAPNCLSPRSRLANLASSLKVMIREGKLDGERSINLRTAREVVLYNAGSEVSMHKIMEGEKVDIKSDEVDFILEGADGKEKILNLPTEIKSRFIDYFRHSSASPYNCYGYVLHLHGWLDEGFSDNDLNYKTVEGVDELRSGDAIRISQKSSQGGIVPMHYAIYIGDGLFLSKMGSGGRVIINSFETIKFLYMTELVFDVMTAKINSQSLINASA